MLVDDDPGVLRLVEIILKRTGYNVATAIDGPTALSLLEEVRPDLFVLDVMMPGMDGLELCRRLRADPRCQHHPIIILSAKSDPRSVRDGLEAGANAYVSKADMNKALVGQISALLSNRHHPAVT
jgi:DNA-binding response OmpR family regulator